MSNSGQDKHYAKFTKSEGLISITVIEVIIASTTAAVIVALINIIKGQMSNLYC